MRSRSEERGLPLGPGGEACRVFQLLTPTLIGKIVFRNLELPTLAHQIVIARGKWPTGLAVELVNFFMVTWQHDAEQHRRDQSQTE